MQFEEAEKQKVFLGLYTPEKDKLWRYIRSMVWQVDDAKDIEAETILRAFKNLENLRNEESFLSFLFGIASRLLKQSARRRRLQMLIGLQRTNESEFHDPAHSIDVEILYKMIKKLSGKEKEAIVLFEISGLSLKEVQALQGGSVTALKTRLSRGRQKLAHLMGNGKPAGNSQPQQAGQLSFSITPLNVKP